MEEQRTICYGTNAGANITEIAINANAVLQQQSHEDHWLDTLSAKLSNLVPHGSSP